jgi:hypothetical protein
MRNATLLLILVLSGAAHGYSAQGRAEPNLTRFSGVWKMDPARSESAHQDVAVGASTLVIRLNANEVTIETTRDPEGDAPPFHELLAFPLDGSERPNTGNAGVAVTGKLRRDGAKLITETARNVQNSTVTTIYVHTLSPNGREMTVDKTLTVQHGYQGMSATNSGHGKDVFIRVSK